MFGRRKKADDNANRLTDQAEPNTIAWTGGVAPAEHYRPNADPIEPVESIDSPEVDEAESLDEPVVLTADEVQSGPDLEADAADAAEESEESESTKIDPIERYGPYGEDVEDVMVALDDVRFEDITSDDLRRLEDAWKSVDAEAAAGVVAVVEPFRTGGKYAEFLGAAEEDVDAWQDGRSTTGKDAELDRVVVEAARDAIDALILQDELDDDQFDVLYGPWADVMDPIEEKGFADVTEQPAAREGAEGAEPPDEGFGPNAPAVREFLATLNELGSDDFKDLTAAFNRQQKAELKRAHDAVHDIVDSDRIQRDRVVAAQDWVSSCLRPTSEMIAGPVTDLKISRSTPTVDRLLVDRAIALPPAIDAVTALVLGDLLDPEDAETLRAPWVELVERDEDGED